MSKTISISSSEQLGTVLQSTPIVIANSKPPAAVTPPERLLVVYRAGQRPPPTMQFSKIYESLSNSLSRAGKISFVKIDFEENGELVQSHGVTKPPGFLIFRDGRLKDRTLGTNPLELRKFAEKIAEESIALEESSGNAATSGWRGAPLPRGYNDVTDQVEIRDCEVLNADDEAGTVRTLFDTHEPSTLQKGKDTASADTKDWVQSGSDDQLLLYIPFQSTIKLHTIQLTSLPSADDEGEVSRPHVVHLFINRPQNMDFAEADDTEPTQVINLSPSDWNDQGTVNIPLRFVKFQKTSTVIIYVQQGDGEAEAVRLDRVKLIGEPGAKREMGNLQKAGDDE
ncbi:Thioredoxin 1 [Cordyceps militaris]|uniref:Thioredoxin 1 n=1 Tax=Cordyceps militaris TaxID=73501 RepID=A0A2H4S8B8_CORMI|nr:Thioredoxin 1 [Cordyceps militaris]